MPTLVSAAINARALTVLVLWLLFSCQTKQTGTNYYIAANGNDANDGTLAHPFKSLNRAETLSLRAGDTLFLRSGETFVGTLRLKLTGTAEHPIVVTSTSSEPATIDGQARESLLIEGKHFIIANLNAKGSGRKSDNTTVGIELRNVDSARVRNVQVEGFQKAGFQLYDASNVVVQNVKAVNNGFSGIHVTASSRGRSHEISILDCLAENNPGDPTNFDNHSGNGILVGLADRVTIDHCVATNNGWDMPRIGNGPVGIWAYESDHITIQYCISYRNRTSKGAKDGGGFDFDGGITNSIIQYCLSYENEGAGYGLFQYSGASAWYNNVVRYCISLNDATSTAGAGGVFIWNGSSDAHQLRNALIHNNLIYSSHAPVVQFEPDSQNEQFRFMNNIFVGSNELVSGPTSGEFFIGNTWWGTGLIFFRKKRFDDWMNADSQEMLDGKRYGAFRDPLLRGDLITNLTDPYQLHSLEAFLLSTNSPEIDNGLPIPIMDGIPSAKTDFFGNPLPGGSPFDRGIHEVH